ncbi:hypothetical protein PRZ48_013250 [Zasmidium cellare]|uniref:Uncharacterized protein n=1 Tax=Zasmidium cellare TaxID=395010 RepID=A0ABR0E3J0_ZASCE|nr:hypothetical protein PRZ48_013250 [Zasmidium cellare]
MGVKPNAINVGNVDLNQLADVIAGQCYTDTETGLAGCDPSEVNVTTTLEGGTQANVVVSVTTQSFQSYAKNLFVAAVAAALDGTAKRNTVNGDGKNSITVATIPPSFFVALERLPEQTVTIGMVVEEIPQGDDTCGEILTVGAAIAGAAGPAGAAAGLALTIASVFCGK